MAAPGASVVVSAALLGVTHTLEPDHVAGISALATGSGETRIATLAGSAFGIGHALLVCGWVGLWYLLSGVHAVPGWMDEVGTALVAALLAVLAAFFVTAALRRVVHRHEHTHDTGGHAHFHVHLPLGSGSDPAHEHEHTPLGYLKMGVLGALFTLSPPLSMIAFLATVHQAVGGTVVWAAVGVYSITIVLGMAALGAGAGRLSGTVARYGSRVHAGLQLATGAVLLAVALHLLWPLL